MPFSSEKMSSGGMCSFKCCSMPTFFNPGGRTLAGGDMMPLVIPWPSAAEQRVSIASRIAAIISGCEFVLLLTALLPFPFYSASVIGWCLNGWRLVSPYSMEREGPLPLEGEWAIRAAPATPWRGRSECAQLLPVYLPSRSCLEFFLPEDGSH